MPGSKGPTKPSNATRAVLPKSDSPSGNAPKFLGQTTHFDAGWPKYKNQDPRLIASVWKEGANHPYQVRTADGTFSQPKGMGIKNRGSLTKDKTESRQYRERSRPNVAGYDGNRNEYTGRGSGGNASGGVKRG